MSQLIKTWKELSKVPDSEKYTLDIEEYCGWVRNKETGDTETYLSTHTFYGKTHEYSTQLLQGYGFDVEIANWDYKEVKNV